MKGVASRDPFLITRKRPPCSAIKILSSGAKASTVGLLMPSATRTWLKPEGKVCANEEKEIDMKEVKRKRNEFKRGLSSLLKIGAEGKFFIKV
ncbi:hypothetical protein ACFS7Z_24225 [Pontibacter toksunensis]|uniref:Uncharacterized protein n=1 Tax=Pontibacter toksunensis TaxID=1332631 RepID=A0ABW6C324_9BACT